MPRHGKNFRKALEGSNLQERFSIEDAISKSLGASFAKFDETVDVAVRLGVDPKYSDQMVRGAVSLPNGTGKTVRVAVFARGAKADEAKAAGADIVGAEDLMETIQSGKIEFDRCIATPRHSPPRSAACPTSMARPMRNTAPTCRRSRRT